MCTTPSSYRWEEKAEQMNCYSCTDARCQPRRPSNAVTLCQALLPPVYLNSAIRYPQDPTRTKTARFDTMAPEEHQIPKQNTDKSSCYIYDHHSRAKDGLSAVQPQELGISRHNMWPSHMPPHRAVTMLGCSLPALATGCLGAWQRARGRRRNERCRGWNRRRVLRSVYIPRGRPVEIAVSCELGVCQ